MTWPIRFGTSGWRGIIGQDFTFTGVRAVVKAIAEHVKGEAGAARGVVVGYDTRFLSRAFAAAAARVLAGSGVRTYLCVRDTPTPVVASEIRRREAAGGIVVTASHNPPEYNGLKFSAATGGPAPPEVTRQIEARANALLARPPEALPTMAEAEGVGLLERIDPRGPYLERIKGFVDFGAIRAAGLKVVVDVLHGSGRDYLDASLHEAGCQVAVLHGERDPRFGGRPPDPGEANLQELMFEVPETSAHLGLATDGDADRFGIVDADGTFVEPNYVLALLLRHLIKTRGWPGGVARSVATTHLLDAVARRNGIPIFETPVGFKYVGDYIAQDRAILAGEESAGLSIRGHVPEKDGILACLLTAELVAVNDKSRLRALLQELYAEVGTLLCRRIDLPVPPGQAEEIGARLREVPAGLGDLQVIEVKRLDGVKLILEDGSWVLIRPSGTEPVVRLYVEATSEALLERLTVEAKALIGAGDA